MAKKSRRQRAAPAKKSHGFQGFFWIKRFLLPPLTAPEEKPWHLLPWLLGVAFLLRSALALAGDFVVHPDEIMQYLEPAHGLVFGNNVSYWEYYYGARSWLVPSLVALWLFLCSIVGLDEPVFYIAAAKLFFCALSLFIPLSLYVVGRRMFGETSARIALILGVFWYELIGYAHKPLTEFVATALLLALMMYALRPQRLQPQQAALAAILAVLIVSVRFQYALAVGIVLLVPFLRSEARIQLQMVAAAAAAVFAIGMFDYFTWGGFLHSYWLNLKVNVVLNEGREAQSSAWVYLGWFTLASGGLFLVALLAAVLDYQRRGFLLLLAAAVVLLHMMQPHREYRFVFVVIPLWLLVFADFLAIGWEQRKKYTAQQWRRLGGVFYAALVSVGGIANTIPYQYLLYKAHSHETGYVHFLRNQDEIFSIYRRLAQDESVRGVFDTTRPYFNTGGYYYLHRKVPFYDPNTASSFPLIMAEQYVSHIISNQQITPQGIVANTHGNLFMQTEKSGFLPVPVFINDASLNKLVYWDAQGNSFVLPGFTPSYQGDKFTIWTADADSTIRGWQRYNVFPDSTSMYQIAQRAFGENSKKPAQNFGIEFADEESTVQ